MPYLQYNSERLWFQHSQILLGSSETNNFTIKGQGVNPTHALIEEHQGAFWIAGINRLSQVLVNGKKIKRQLLKDQDLISIGDQVLSYHLYIHHEMTAKASSSHSESLQAYQRLYEFSQKLAEQIHSSELFEVMLEELIALSKADHGFLVSTQNNVLHLRSALDRFHQDDFNDHINQMSESIIEHVCQSREPLLQNDLLEAESFNHSASILELGLCSVMCVPLIFEGELLGVIYVGSRRPTHTFQSSDLKTLCIFSAQAATLLKLQLSQESLINDNQRLKGALEGFKYGSIIGHSLVMQKVFERIDRLRESEINLLIMGESGTGKELIAREVHRGSKRKDQAFVAINCGALPSTLIESELFGYQKGAFTGAVSDKAGSLASAQGGTLFLDEIGELPLALQVKLLRVLEERSFTPLGAQYSIPLDIRLICATNKDLQKAVETDEFRLDLYYRINSFELTLPPLRERGDDVVLLAKYLLERISVTYERKLKPIALEAQQGLKRYSWPGNIRELENRIAQAVILSDGDEITLYDLNLAKEVLNEPMLSLKEAQERFSQEYVQHILDLNRGNRTQAAKDLGVDPRTVFRYLEKISDS